MGTRHCLKNAVIYILMGKFPSNYRFPLYLLQGCVLYGLASVVSQLTTLNDTTSSIIVIVGATVYVAVEGKARSHQL